MCVHPKLLISLSPPHFLFGNCKLIFNVSKSVSVLQRSPFLFFLKKIPHMSDTIYLSFSDLLHLV